MKFMMLTEGSFQKFLENSQELIQINSHFQPRHHAGNRQHKMLHHQQITSGEQHHQQITSGEQHHQQITSGEQLFPL